MDLSVIIISYNVKYFLEQCLFSVRKASKSIDCEIFVADNNSVDGSCSMVKSQFPVIKLIMNSTNRVFSVSNNQALKLATCRLSLNRKEVFPFRFFQTIYGLNCYLNKYY